MLDGLKAENNALRKALLQLETECVEQKIVRRTLAPLPQQRGGFLLTCELHILVSFQEVTDAYEIAYREIKSEILDHQQTFFRAVEDSENQFNEAIVNIAEQWVKQAQDGNLDAVSDELAAVRCATRACPACDASVSRACAGGVWALCDSSLPTAIASSGISVARTTHTLASSYRSYVAFHTSVVV